MIRLKAKNPSGSHAYFMEPYTVQHFVDWLLEAAKTWLVEFPQFLWANRTKKRRVSVARKMNEIMFGSVPPEQVVVFDGSGPRPMTPEERYEWLGK